ncbi:MAG TPA: hypothetical protein VE957_20970, partial [Terriglobales bacterium]|nr:hypothetical protein [Terriglobales bacterium]
ALYRRPTAPPALQEQGGASFSRSESIDRVKDAIPVPESNGPHAVTSMSRTRVPKIAKWRSWAPSMTYENAILGGFSTETRLKNWPEPFRA